MGRACALLAQGDPAGAWALHPGAFGLAAYAGWMLLPLSARRRRALPRRASTAAGLLLLALLLCRWALVLQGHIEV
jgi:hypothetical protein